MTYTHCIDVLPLGLLGWALYFLSMSYKTRVLSCLVLGMVNYPVWILIQDTLWMLLTMSNSNPGSKQLIANLANNELQRLLGIEEEERLRKISKLIR